MTQNQRMAYKRMNHEIKRWHNMLELARGFMRYEALRKLNARQYAELMDRCYKGEAFDDLVDELVVEEVS